MLLGLVFVEGPVIPEFFQTKWTGKGSLSIVKTHVLLEILKATVSLVTDVTHVVFELGVCSQMSL